MSDNPRKNPDNAFRAVADEGGLVVDPNHHDVKVLNPVGSRIYSLLDGSNSVDQIVSTIVGEFDVDEAQARSDLESFLEDLQKRGMLAGKTLSESGAAASGAPESSRG